MSDSTNVIQQFDTPATVEERKSSNDLRTTLADTYTFVRSAEVNKTISSFTFDHYIDEAKREIKQDTVLRSASDPNNGVGTRPSKLTALAKLQQDFNNGINKMMTLAKAKDSSTGGTQ